MLLLLSRRTLVPLLALSSSTARALSKMSFTTQRSGGTITISPKNEADQSGLVVISHGLGDTAEGFADVAEVGFGGAMPCVL
jgi:predicted dienelactone hydrolase